MVRAAVACPVPSAAGGARSSAQNALCMLARPWLTFIRHPRAAVVGRTDIILVPGILAPFSDAVISVDSPCVWREKFCWRKTTSLKSGHTARKYSFMGFGDELGQFFRQGITPTIWRVGSRPRCIFPFGLARQAVVLSGAFAQPLRICTCVKPIHVVHGEVVRLLESLRRHAAKPRVCRAQQSPFFHNGVSFAMRHVLDFPIHVIPTYCVPIQLVQLAIGESLAISQIEFVLPDCYQGCAYGERLIYGHFSLRPFGIPALGFGCG